MNSTATLTELLNYSKTLDLETNGWYGAIFNGYFGIGMIAFGIILLLMALHSILHRKEMEKTSGVQQFRQSLFGLSLFGIILVGFGSFGMTHFFSDMLTKESYALYDLEERKWEREMATPFLESLPVTTIKGIENITYNYDMEIEEDKKFSTDKRTDDAIPVTVVTNSGMTYDIWATVEPLAEDMNESTLEMKNLETDLVFHERSKVFKEKGYFDVVLYTDEEI